MVKWEVVFSELKEALETACKKYRYKETSRLRLKIQYNNKKVFIHRTTMQDINSLLWQISSENEDTIMRFAVESSHGRLLFLRSLYHTEKGKGAQGDQVTIETFEDLIPEAKTLRTRLLQCQIQDRLCRENDSKKEM